MVVQPSLKEARNLSLDIARIIAILAVIMIHVSSDFVTQFPPFSPEHVWGNIFDSLSRIAVTFFLMISGSLLLDERKPISLRNLYFKKIVNLLFLLFFWSLIYAIVNTIIYSNIDGTPISIDRIIKEFILGHFHLWYFYMIVGLYAITPFLRAFTKKASPQLVLIFIIFSIFSQFSKPIIGLVTVYLPDFKIAETFIDSFYLQFFSGFTSYYLIGWYVVHVGFDKIKRICIYVIGILSLIAVILLVFFTNQSVLLYTELDLLVLLYSLALFVLINKLKLKYSMQNKLHRLIKLISKLSFDMYLIHVAIFSLLFYFVPYSSLPALYMLMVWIVTAIVSFGISYGISKIPFVKKIIRV